MSALQVGGALVAGKLYIERSADLRLRDLDPRGAAERVLSMASIGLWEGAVAVLRAQGWWPGQLLPR